MKIRNTIGNPVFLVPFALLCATAILRAWCIGTSDLPAGDEINTYIYNAQHFAASRSLPGLDNFPLTAVVYGAIISLVDQFAVTLSGVIAGHVVMVLSGVICVYCTYRGVSKAADERTGMVAASAVAFFPGTLLVFRADISLYYIFMPALSLSLISLVLKPGYCRAVLPGILGAMFYMSRSDGLFVFFLAVLLFSLCYRTMWRMSVVAILAFVLVMSCYWGVTYIQHGKLGGGAKDRAIAAFYQAEGLHDGKGGDWHDYTRRGIKRFGPQQEYNNSVILLMLKNTDAVYERVVANLTLVNRYLKTLAIPVWLVVVLSVSALIGRYRRIVLVFAFPCILTSCIYLAFYYQISYFTILSYGLAICSAMGLLTVLETAMNAIGLSGRNFNRVAAIALVMSAGFLAYTAVQLHPPRRTTADRYWQALTLVKQRCRNASPKCHFSPPYRGSNAMPIFADLPFSPVDYGLVAKLPQPEQRQFLAKRGIAYLLCGREHKDLWQPGVTGEDVVFSNDRNDVKIVALHLAEQFKNSGATYFSITPATGSSAVRPRQQIGVAATAESLELEASGGDSFVLLPALQSSASPFVALKIAMWSPVDTELKIYYSNRSDNDFDEKRSATKGMRKGMNIVYLALPAGLGKTVHLRMDPGTAAGIYKLYSLEARAI